MTPMRMPDDAKLVRLALRVRDIEATLGFYTGVLGFTETDRSGDTVSIALRGGRFTIDLVSAPDAPLRPYPCVGLYHFALVVPDRAALGTIFRRLIEERFELEGMSDHAVSEALYLRDPEMNGIELYRDRPKTEWSYDDAGHIAMVSIPLDADGVIGAASGPGALDADTRFGHIHLHVHELEVAETFYGGDVGLGVTQRSLPGALFFAAGDYHHHVGTNVWAPNDVAPADATGLLSYTWLLPAEGDVPSDPLRDPSGADVYFSTAG